MKEKIIIEEDNTISIGKRIKELIEENKISQKKFAQSILYSPQYVNEIIKGKKYPSTRFLYAVCYEYNISLTWLKTGEGDKFTTNASLDIDIKYANSIFEELNPILRKLLLKVLKTFLEFEKNNEKSIDKLKE